MSIWRRVVCGAIVAAVCSACSEPNDPNGTRTANPPPPVAESTNSSDETTDDESRMTTKDALSGLEAAVSDMDLYMHDIEPTGQSRRTPTLWVHAAEGQLKADSSWALADAHAVIYREREEEIQLVSKAGRFDEVKKIAVLDGGVSVAAGGMQMSTDSVSYDNTQRVVQTLAPVQLSDGKTTLNAEGATLMPDDGAVTLTNVSGTLSLDGELE